MNGGPSQGWRIDAAVEEEMCPKLPPPSPEMQARADAEWGELDGRTALQQAHDYLARMRPSRRAMLEKEWDA